MCTKWVKIFADIAETFIIAWEVSKYGVISGPYFTTFSTNTEKYGQWKNLYSDTFHAV